jgi:succinyl-diaminopimelate desuccinylase
VADAHGETLELARSLIACRSVTPADGGALDIVGVRLGAKGFRCERFDRGVVGNLWARRGQEPPLVCFAGHVDVVPAGALDLWSSDPFSPAERDGYLYGRGANDMKTSVAAMVTAAERFVAGRPDHRGSLAVLLTSDEEGDALDGTAVVVERLRAQRTAIDACIVGEPTSVNRLGDTMKNGRRGSLGGRLIVKGVQCHIAYPERGRSPIHSALPALAELAAGEWDRGNEFFQPTSFQISNVHAGTGATNVIPGTMEVLFNLRFSPESTEEGIKARVRETLDRHHLEYDLSWSPVARPFMTGKGKLVDALSAAIEEVTGLTPVLSTSGGTSDGRFLAAVAREVVEFGPLSEGMHGIDERVRLADIGPLSVVYERTLEALLAD